MSFQALPRKLDVISGYVVPDKVPTVLHRSQRPEDGTVVRVVRFSLDSEFDVLEAAVDGVKTAIDGVEVVEDLRLKTHVGYCTEITMRREVVAVNTLLTDADKFTDHVDVLDEVGRV